MKQRKNAEAAWRFILKIFNMYCTHGLSVISNSFLALGLKCIILESFTQLQHLLQLLCLYVVLPIAFFMQQYKSSPSGLTPLTFLSQPHLSSSPRVQARVTATATAAEDKACTKAASRVPITKTEDISNWNLKREIHRTGVWCVDTLVHDSAEDVDSTWGGGTVPAAVPELVLALVVSCMQQLLKALVSFFSYNFSCSFNFLFYLFYDHFRCLSHRLHDLPSCPAHPHLPRGQPP